MINALISITFVYLFIFLGYLIKSIFKERLDSKTLTILSLYCLQPFVTIWGFSTSKFTFEQLFTPILYLGIIAIILIPTIYISKLLFADRKERAIFTIAGFVGNTGNIGIPLGIALFGEQSVIYTTLINIANVLVIYILGVYIYSRGSFSIKKSLLNILKIPAIPASIVAAALNIYGVEFTPQVKEFFKMGAYAGIVLQLFLLGTFLSGIKLREISNRLFFGVMGQKFILVPLATYIILSFIHVEPLLKNILLMQMLTPLAIANINLAAIYDCRPKDVTTLILISTVAFAAVVAFFGYYLTN